MHLNIKYLDYFFFTFLSFFINSATFAATHDSITLHKIWQRPIELRGNNHVLVYP